MAHGFSSLFFGVSFFLYLWTIYGMPDDARHQPHPFSLITICQPDYIIFLLNSYPENGHVRILWLWRERTKGTGVRANLA